jgi:hypothetical protein
MQTKQYIATAMMKNDSLSRIDLRQSLGLYTVTLDFVYGRAIPERYFSIDKMDRTDAVIRISLAPFVRLARTSKVKLTGSGQRMEALRDSIAAQMPGFSSSGIALAWRAGLITLRRLSRSGGLDASLNYYGLWCTGFRSGGAPLRNRDVNRSLPDADGEVSYFSNRFEITFSLVRKL